MLSRSYIKRFVWYNLYDSNRFSNFHCVYTIIPVVHTEFITDIPTEYSALKSSSKVIQEQTPATVIIARTSFREKQVKEKEKKKEEFV